MLKIWSPSSCTKDTVELTDAELIIAIQEANNKQAVSAGDLPNDAATVLVADFTESYVEEAKMAPELGYEVIVRRGESSQIGERSEVYFNLDGRELRRGRDEPVRGDDGTDREECFELVYPVTYVMPDGTTVSGTPEQLRAAISAWYQANSDTREEPVLQYPVDVTFEDGTIETVNSEEELRDVYASCEDSEESDFDCPALRANIGDTCYFPDRTAGTVSAACACE